MSPLLRSKVHRTAFELSRISYQASRGKLLDFVARQLESGASDAQLIKEMDRRFEAALVQVRQTGYRRK